MTTGRVLSRSMHPAEQPSYMHLQVQRTNRAQQRLLGKNFRGMYCWWTDTTATRDAARCCPRDHVAGRSAIQVDRLAYRWALAFEWLEGNGPRTPHFHYAIWKCTVWFCTYGSVGIISFISLNQPFTLYSVLLVQIFFFFANCHHTNLGVLLCFSMRWHLRATYLTYGCVHFSSNSSDTAAARIKIDVLNSGTRCLSIYI